MVREPCTAFRVRCTYADYPRLKAELPALLARLGAVEFDDSVNVRLVVKDDDAQAFCARFSELFNGRLTPEEDGHFMELCEIDGGAVLADADEE
jgi:putative IMPACT (imprinted ancient) family translation regulator